VKPFQWGGSHLKKKAPRRKRWKGEKGCQGSSIDEGGGYQDAFLVEVLPGQYGKTRDLGKSSKEGGWGGRGGGPTNQGKKFLFNEPIQNRNCLPQGGGNGGILKSGKGETKTGPTGRSKGKEK